MRVVLVPLMLMLSSTVMALAWLGHLRFQRWSFMTALVVSWMLVLPEYVLNVVATRYGYGVYSGAQMASIHLSAGVVCVALVSRFVLGETLRFEQWLGFGLMVAAIFLLVGRGPEPSPTVESTRAPQPVQSLEHRPG